MFQLVVDFIFITRAVGTLPEIRLSASPPKIRLKAHALTRRKQIELIMALIRQTWSARERLDSALAAMDYRRALAIQTEIDALARETRRMAPKDELAPFSALLEQPRGPRYTQKKTKPRTGRARDAGLSMLFLGPHRQSGYDKGGI